MVALVRLSGNVIPTDAERAEEQNPSVLQRAEQAEQKLVLLEAKLRELGIKQN